MRSRDTSEGTTGSEGWDWVGTLAIARDGVFSAIGRAVDLFVAPANWAFGLDRRQTSLARIAVPFALTIVFAAGWFLPDPFWMVALLLGLYLLLAVFRAWQRGESHRERVLGRQIDSDPDAMADFSGLALFAALFLLPMFALLFQRIDSAIGGFEGAGGFWAMLLFTLDNLIDVVTFDSASALGLRFAGVEAQTELSKLLIAFEKVFLGAMLIGGLAALIRSSQASRDGIAVLDTYPDVALRLGQRARAHILRRLRSPPPPESTGDLGGLREGATYQLLKEALQGEDPMCSANAAWIARRLRDPNLMEMVATRLGSYEAFFLFLKRDHFGVKLEQEVLADPKVRKLEYRVGKVRANGYQKRPAAAEEVFETAYVRDICELLHYLEQFYEPVPREDHLEDGVLTFLNCPSPAIRAAAARYAAVYATYAFETVAVAETIAMALEREPDIDAIKLQLRTLKRFGSRERAILDRIAEKLVHPDREVRQLAGAALVASNDAEAVGYDAIRLMLKSGDPYLETCVRNLVQDEPGDAIAPALVGHVNHGDLRGAIWNYIRRVAPDCLMIEAIGLLNKRELDGLSEYQLAQALSGGLRQSSTWSASVSEEVGRAISTHPNMLVRQPLMESVAGRGDAALDLRILETIEEEIRAWTPSSDNTLLMSGALACGEIGSDLAIAIIMDLRRLGDERLTAHCDEVLSRLERSKE